MKAFTQRKLLEYSILFLKFLHDFEEMQGLIVLTLGHIFKQDIKSLLVSIVMLTLHLTRSCVMSKIVK